MKTFCDLSLLSYFDLTYDCTTVCEFIEAIKQDEQLPKQCEAMPEFKGNYAMLLELDSSLYEAYTIKKYYNDNKNSGVVYYIFSTEDYDIYAFRGSEGFDEVNNRTGWQDWADNLRMFRPQASAQQLYAYHEFQKQNQQRPFYLCGHSKGGNLALFCSLVMQDEYIQRCKGVYTFNAPGIQESMLSLYEHRKNDDQYIQRLHIYENEHDTISSFFEHLKQPITIASNMSCNNFEQLFHCHNLYAYQFHNNTYVQAKTKSVMPYLVHQFVYNYFSNLSKKRLERMIALGDDFFNSGLSAQELYRVFLYQISSYTSLFDDISYDEVKTITLQDLINRRKSRKIKEKIKNDINGIANNEITQAIIDNYDYYVKRRVEEIQQCLTINNNKIIRSIQQINKTKE